LFCERLRWRGGHGDPRGKVREGFKKTGSSGAKKEKGQKGGSARKKVSKVACSPRDTEKPTRQKGKKKALRKRKKNTEGGTSRQRDYSKTHCQELKAGGNTTKERKRKTTGMLAIIHYRRETAG